MRVIKVILMMFAVAGLAQLALTAQCDALKFTEVSSFNANSLALRDDGTVWQWGNGQNVPVQIPITGVRAISAGGTFSMALKNDGTVWVWGQNSYGQYGDGTTNQSNYTQTTVTGADGVSRYVFYQVPVQARISGVKAVSAGGSHALALKEDGTVWAWGADYRDQLGMGRVVDPLQANPRDFSAVPAEVKGLSNVTLIFAGIDASYAVSEDGSVWGWGNNLIERGAVNVTGMIENSDRWMIDQPVKLNHLTDVQKISPGDAVLVLKKDGSVWGWGEDYNNQIGDLSSSAGSSLTRVTPVKANLDSVIDVSPGIALKEGGTVWTWGDGTWGQLGIGTVNDLRYRPVQAKITGVTQVSGDKTHVVLKSDGTVWAWGSNYEGEVGDGSNDKKVHSPIEVLSNETQPVVAIAKHIVVTTPTPISATMTSDTFSPNSSIGSSTSTDANTSGQAQVQNSFIDLRVVGFVLFILVLAGGIFWARKRA